MLGTISGDVAAGATIITYLITSANTEKTSFNEYNRLCALLMQPRVTRYNKKLDKTFNTKCTGKVVC